MKQHTQRITKRSIPGVTLHPRDGYYQVRHIGLTARRVKTDPAFHNTRREAKHFAQIVKTAKLISDALLPGTGIKKTIQRLIPLLRRILHPGTAGNETGPTLHPAGWTLLEGFECNGALPWQAVMHIHPAIHYLPGQPQVTVTFPPIIPAAVMHPPEGIAHGRIYIIHACIDDRAQTCNTQKSRTTIIPCSNMTLQLKPLTTRLCNQPGRLHLLAIGVEWYHRHNANGALQRSVQPAVLRIIHASVIPKKLKNN